MRLVISPAVEKRRLDKIVAAAGEMEVVNAATWQDALAAMPEAEAFFGKLTPELLSAASRLRWVQSPTASLEHFLFPALVEHPCQLTNMRGLFNDVIADQVFGYILCFARNLHVYLRQQQERRWEPAGGESERTGFATGPGVQSAIDRAHLHLADCTLGIVGLGQIGCEIARRGLAFGMRVVAVDPRQTQAPASVAALWPLTNLSQLLAESDFTVIAAPHTPHTERLFSAERFEQMKRGSYLVNIGRGAIVDLADLAAALQNGRLAGAALDVFEIEPLPPEHVLWGLPNVILTPHVAGCSPRIAERHLNVLLQNIERFRSHQPLLNVANKQLWY